MEGSGGDQGTTGVARETGYGHRPPRRYRSVALPLVKEFEGCRLPAYPDPETGAEPWTIGWGSTTYKDGAPVQLAHRNSQHDGFSGIHGGNKLNSVEDQGDLYGSVADAFVAIHERVVLDQGEAQRCRQHQRGQAPD